MKLVRRSDTVTFTTKGQVVIPLPLRRRFEIEEGTRATLSVTKNGILLKPITPATIRLARGIVAKKPGDKAFAEEWAEHKRRELALEDK
ncbi:MAG: AbrB/MazE/SpoVT family DNA-binding domain-containing protein [Methylacidiphilales bacterium]|nr:AbrB/MazE/SpoVT family DNA-binding domain-containing protein [Candidatus Methylacidiphilales bacterium]